MKYHGHDVSIIWDRDGNRYGKGVGLHVFVDGDLLAQSDTLSPISVSLPARQANDEQGSSDPSMRRVNFAVNNDGDYFPRLQVSSTGPKSAAMKLIDGNYWYHIDPPNRWTSALGKDAANSIELNLGVKRPLDTIKLYLLDDRDQQGESASVVPPTKLQVEWWSAEQGWQSIPDQHREPSELTGHRPLVIVFPTMNVARLRFTLTPAEGKQVGLTEIECWGDAVLPVQPAPAPEGNIAFRRGSEEFPKVTASHTSRFDKLETVNDGRIVYAPTPANRWTSYESKSKSDWLEIEFAKPERVSRVVLHIYDDGGGVQPPESYRVEYESDGEWQPVAHAEKSPETPTGSTANTVRFEPVETRKMRVTFHHQGEARSGLTELEVWRD